MISNKISRVWFARFSLDVLCCTYNLSRQPIRAQWARHRVSYMQNMEFFYLVPSHSHAFQGHGGENSFTDTRVLPPPNHRQPSRGPVEASRLLSVSEASVCSVDMDEMSLMEDDWEGVALLLTAASEG